MRPQHEHLLATVHIERDQRTVADLASGRCGKNLGMTQLERQFLDAALVDALSLASGMITAVLAQIAFGTCRGHLGDDLVAVFALAPLQLFLHLVVGLLRQQEHLILLCHIDSFIVRRKRRCLGPRRSRCV